MNKQIEKMTCKDCLHYEVCVYVNAKAVEFARAENCKLFSDKNGYRKVSDVAMKIFAEVERKLIFIRDADTDNIRGVVPIKEITIIKKKYESEGENNG